MFKKSSLFLTYGMFLVALLVGCLDKKPAAQPSVDNISQAESQQVKVTEWNPHTAVAGQGFNLQRDGDSAIWIRGSIVGDSSTYTAMFGDTKISNVAVSENKLVSFQVHKSLTANPGKYPIILIVKASGQRID